MFKSSELWNNIYKIPAVHKREIIENINQNYREGRGQVYNNTEVIYNWLTKNNYRGEPTLEGINEYIEEFFHPKFETEEYFEERIPEIDDTEEIKQIEEEREEIDRKIMELRENEIRKKEQQEQIEQREEETINNLIKSLYEKPFETDIPLIILSLSECEKLAPLLKNGMKKRLKQMNSTKKLELNLQLMVRNSFGH